MRQVGMEMTQRVTRGASWCLDGSHLFPMEHPITTAAAIEASLLNLDSITDAQALSDFFGINLAISLAITFTCDATALFRF